LVSGGKPLLPSHVRAFRERRRDEKGRKALLKSLQALFEGQFARAEKLASEAHELGAAPDLASLLAARATQRLREFDRRDRWLQRAAQGDEDWRLARLMTTAELLLDERRFDEARKVLRELNANGHPASLLLLRGQGAANWEKSSAWRSEKGRDAGGSAGALNARIDAPQDHGEGSPGPGRWSERTRPNRVRGSARLHQLGDCRRAHRAIEEALERGGIARSSCSTGMSTRMPASV
jgi:hypothetical protein